MEASRLDYGRMNQPSAFNSARACWPYHLLDRDAET